MAGRRAARVGALVLVAMVTGALALPATGKPPTRKYTPAGNAVAKSISLKASDLPKGWKSVKGTSGGGGVTCPTFNPDQSDLTSIGHADTGFESADGLGNVASVVGVFKTPAQGQTSWDRVVRPGLLGCMESFVEESPGPGTTITVTSKGPLALKVPGQRHAAYRIVADVKAGSDRAKVYLDLILQGAGSVDSVIILTWVLKPPPVAFEKKLAALVAARLPK